jgi:carbon-monoxide dehydrogenase medium subunit
VIPTAFDYTRPASLDEALSLLSNGSGSKVIAGGQSLLPLLKLRLASADRLIDIGRLGELKGIRSLPDGRLAIGALTTYAELMESPARHYGLLMDALPTIGDVQVRNRGTVGGAIAHADPASDLPACLLALDTEVVVRSSRGERSIAIAEFFQDSFQTAIAEDELLTEVRLPGPRNDAGSAYSSLEQPASGYAIVGVAAVVVRPEAKAPIGMSAIAITGVGPVAYRASAVEKALSGSDGSPAAIAAAAAHATDGVTVNSDIHADREYRAEMARVFTVRAIEAALARLG